MTEEEERPASQRTRSAKLGFAYLVHTTHHSCTVHCSRRLIVAADYCLMPDSLEEVEGDLVGK